MWINGLSLILTGWVPGFFRFYNIITIINWLCLKSRLSTMSRLGTKKKLDYELIRQFRYTFSLFQNIIKAISIYRISLSTFCINVSVYVWKKQKTSLCVKKKSKKFENHYCCISSNVTRVPRVTEGYKRLTQVTTG